MARACLALGVYQARRKRGVSITQAWQNTAQEIVREPVKTYRYQEERR
jgi:hypothetical protein